MLLWYTWISVDTDRICCECADIGERAIAVITTAVVQLLACRA